MVKKKLPLWLKGGLIGAVIHIALLVIYLLYFSLLNVLFSGYIPGAAWILPIITGHVLYLQIPVWVLSAFGCDPFASLELCGLGVSILTTVLQWVIPIGLYFLVGALIAVLWKKKRK